jgi:lipopolysaccharide transport system permease protein
VTSPALTVAPDPPITKRVRRSPSAAQIIAEVWDARDLVAQFVRRDLTIRYTQAVMGVAWAILMPMLIVGAGVMFRIVLATLSNTHVEGTSIVSIAAKALPWAFFAGAISTATQSIIGNANLIGKVYFPREALPLSTVLAQCPDLVIGLLLVTIILPFVGVGLSWSYLWVVPILVLLVAFTTGASLLLSCANLFFRDVKYIVQVLLNFGVFATPVFFEPQMLGRKGGAIMLALPLSPLIEGLDIAMIRGKSLLSTVAVTTAKGVLVVWSPWMLLYATVLSLSVLLVGLRIFRGASSRFAEMA